MKALAAALFTLAGLGILAMFTLFFLGIRFGDGRFGMSGFLTIFFIIIFGGTGAIARLASHEE